MKLFVVLSVLLPLISAGPFPPLTNTFHLKTAVPPGQQGKERFDGLWMTTYHTSASTNDVQFLPTRTNARVAALNGTHLQIKFSRGNFPWGLYLPTTVQYTQWQPAELNAGYGRGRYRFDDDRLKVKLPGFSFGGWRVCEWWHGVPQLFWITYGPAKLLPNCADVDLVKVPIE